MSIQTIPRPSWEIFFDRFSSEHEGWPVSIEVDDKPIKDLVEAHNVALDGITADQKDGENSIIVTVGGRDDNKRLDHEVKGPTKVQVDRTGDGAEHELVIDSAIG